MNLLQILSATCNELPLDLGKIRSIHGMERFAGSQTTSGKAVVNDTNQLWISVIAACENPSRPLVDIPGPRQ
jgi:hypothetical protein